MDFSISNLIAVQYKLIFSADFVKTLGINLLQLLFSLLLLLLLL